MNEVWVQDTAHKKKEEKEKIGNLASQTDAEEKRSKRILGVREQENGVASN